MADIKPLNTTEDSPQAAVKPVMPGVLATKPKQVPSKFRQEAGSLAKMNTEQAAVGEVNTDAQQQNEDKTAGEFRMDRIAYLQGYKEAGGATGRVVPGTDIQVGSNAARDKARALLDKLRASRGMPAAAPNKQHASAKETPSARANTETKNSLLSE